MSRIVIVDSSPVTLQVYERILKQIPDAEIVAFTSSYDAFNWADQNAADLVIIDYRMPTLDGLGFTEAFRGKPERVEIPILMTTNPDDGEVRYRALRMGADDFLEKPAAAVELVARARNLLKLREMRALVRVQRETIERMKRVAAGPLGDKDAA